MTLTQEVMRSYLQRWEAVADIEETERRQTSITQRWQKTNSLLSMSGALGLVLKVDEENYGPDQPWNHLRSLYIDEKKGVPS